MALDDDARIIGFVHYVTHRSTWSDKPYCYLEDLYVAPDTRRTGAARALIAGVEAAARDHGCAEMYLVSADDNASARALYDQILEKTPFIEYRINLK